MSNIDELLQVDEDNTRKMRDFLRDMDPSSLETAELAADLLDAAAQAFGQATSVIAKERVVNEWCARHGMTMKDAFRLLLDASIIGPDANDDTAMAKRQLHEGHAIYTRGYLLMRLKRDYMFGLSDLLRNRVVSAVGYLRLESETLALIKLMSLDPEFTAQWWRADQSRQGVQFHRKHHSRIVELLDTYNLRYYYDRASATSLHSRVLGIASGALHEIEDPPPGSTRVIQLCFQDADTAELYFLEFCSFMRAQERVLAALPDALPEVPGGTPTLEEIAAFRAQVDGLWTTLRPHLDALRTRGVEEALLQGAK